MVETPQINDTDYYRRRISKKTAKCLVKYESKHNAVNSTYKQSIIANKSIFAPASFRITQHKEETKCRSSRAQHLDMCFLFH